VTGPAFRAKNDGCVERLLLGGSQMFANSPVRRVRTVATVIATTVAASLVSLVGTTSPAQADLLPYVPWSSYLPGWTDQYVPTSDNDCVAGRANCLNGTLKEQSRIADDTASSCSHNAIFARAYVRMTQLYGYTRDIPGYYQDVPYFNHVDAVFARYYTDAYYNWKNGDRASVPQAWLTAFDAAANKKVSGSGDLLLGMNAHINRDLPFVHAAIGLVKPDGSSRKPDHDKVDEFLNRVQVTEELAARFDPTVKDTEVPGPFDNMTVMQLIFSWREIAWRNAERLAAAGSDAERKTVAASIEAYAASEAEAIRAATSYLPVVQSSKERDAFCAAHG
jgi:hypothetical protein